MQMKYLAWAVAILGLWIVIIPWATNISDIDWLNYVGGGVILILGILAALTSPPEP